MLERKEAEKAEEERTAKREEQSKAEDKKKQEERNLIGLLAKQFGDSLVTED